MIGLQLSGFMIVIINKWLPAEAKEKLIGFGLSNSMKMEFMELETQGIVHPTLSCHPDIFFCNTPSVLVVSPSVPDEYNDFLTAHKAPFKPGTRSTVMQHPGEVYYSASVSEQFLVHHLQYTDPVILENCHYLNKIDVRQGYTSCSLILLKKGHYLTSDKGIDMTLEQKGLKGLYIPSEEIFLPGFQNGQIGGTMGLYKETLFIAGSLDHFGEGEVIRNFIQKLNYSVIELIEGPLTDYGGILFPESG